MDQGQLVDDPQFPAEGPVFEEAPKPLPGLAGESRSGDANGQWFRILVAGGTNLVDARARRLRRRRAFPINGANPPRPTARPPLPTRCPCETQARPTCAPTPGAAAAAAAASTPATPALQGALRPRCGKAQVECAAHGSSSRAKLGLKVRSSADHRDEASAIGRRPPRAVPARQGEGGEQVKRAISQAPRRLHRDHRADRRSPSGVSVYILSKQRLRFPLIEEKPFVAATPSSPPARRSRRPGPDRPRVRRAHRRHRRRRAQGRPRRRRDAARPGVHGPRPHRRDARCCGPRPASRTCSSTSTRARTTRRWPSEGWTIPIRTTLPDVNPDEILAALDARHARLPEAAASTAPAEGLEGPRRRPARRLRALRADPPRPRARQRRGRRCAARTCAG